MTIPDKLPEWATDVGADIVEPSLAQKQDGWDVDDQPPPGWWNWWNNNVYQWIDTLKSALLSKPWTKGQYDQVATPQIICGVYGVVEGNGLFLKAGTGGVIFTSPDGRNWTERTPAGSYTDTWQAAAFGWPNGETDGRFLLVGENGEIQTSDNGINWTQKTADASYTDDFSAACWGYPSSNELFVIGGENGEIQTSPDGTTWTHRTAADSFTGVFQDATFGYNLATELFLLVSGSGSGTAQTSEDGITWTTRALPANHEPACCTFGNEQFVLGGGGTDKISTSPDGINYTAQDLPVTAPPGGYGTLSGAEYINGYYILAGSDIALIISGDGENWYPPLYLEEGNFTGAKDIGTLWGIAAGQDMCVVGGENGLYFRATMLPAIGPAKPHGEIWPTEPIV